LQQLRDDLEGTPDPKPLAVREEEMVAPKALQADYAAGGGVDDLHCPGH
jgi:hypothetical protein